MSNSTPFESHRYFVMTVDPVHVGTGGSRLGRVDNSIIREPGTRLPKIPGTSLSGAVRHYAAYRFGKRNCAGQKDHCCRPTCPICYTFGTANDAGSGYKGMVSIGDARLVLFPVYSMVGPVWVTCPTALQDAGIINESIKLAGRETMLANDLQENDWLNLGWLMVEKKDHIPSLKPDFEIPDQVANRLVIISEKLFSQVVNSNLEVRTSVSIDPATGAAEDGALFTYEAIPRAAFLWMDIIVDDFRNQFPSKTRLEEWKSELEDGNRQAKLDFIQNWALTESDEQEKIDEALAWVQEDLDRYKLNTLPQPGAGWHEGGHDGIIHLVTAGFEWADHLGVGGMGTRGFGRIRIVPKATEQVQEEISTEEETS
jgi:CRISPR-associated protein Cmr4